MYVTDLEAQKLQQVKTYLVIIPVFSLMQKYVHYRTASLDIHDSL